VRKITKIYSANLGLIFHSFQKKADNSF